MKPRKLMMSIIILDNSILHTLQIDEYLQTAFYIGQSDDITLLCTL
jgi:hypothetical protein